MDEQRDKLDEIIDLVKKLNAYENENEKLRQQIEKSNLPQPAGYKNIVPFVIMGIVCLAGYGTHKYQQRKK